MKKNNNSIDYGGAFDKLKADLIKANKKTQSQSPDRYPHAFGLLSMAVKQHLVACSDLTLEDIEKEMYPDPNDIPEELFRSHKIF